MNRWLAEIHVWPHSTERGRETDQKEAGDRVQKIEVTGDSIDDALKAANLFRLGVETNPMVWRAPIFKIERTSC